MNIIHANKNIKIIPYPIGTEGLNMYSPIIHSEISFSYDENLNKTILKQNTESNDNLNAESNDQSLDTSISNLNQYNNNNKFDLNFVNLSLKNQIILNEKKGAEKYSSHPTGSSSQNKLTTPLHTEEVRIFSNYKKYLGAINMITPVKSNDQINLNNISSINDISITNNQLKKNNHLMDINVSKYLKSFSKFNAELASYQYFVYNFYNNKKKLIKNITSILNSTFISLSCLISRPVLNITSQKIVIQLFYYCKKNSNSHKNEFKYKNKFKFDKNNSLNFLTANQNKLKLLCLNLSKFLKKPVDLELVRLYSPYNDSNILANTIGLLSHNPRNKFRFLVDKTFVGAKIKKNSILNSIPKPYIFDLSYFLTGINIRLGGRLLSQPIRPKFTVQEFQKGSLVRANANFVTSSRYTNKNKRGTFSITVTMGYRFF